MRYIEEVFISQQLIKVKIEGHTTEDQLASHEVVTRILARDLHCGVFFDFRQANPQITISEAYFWIAKHYDVVDPMLRHVPVAFLINGRDRIFFDFWETTFTNNGAVIRIFEEETDAVAWLRSLFKVSTQKK